MARKKPSMFDCPGDVSLLRLVWKLTFLLKIVLNYGMQHTNTKHIDFFLCVYMKGIVCSSWCTCVLTCMHRHVEVRGQKGVSLDF